MILSILDLYVDNSKSILSISNDCPNFLCLKCFGGCLASLQSRPCVYCRSLPWFSVPQPPEIRGPESREQHHQLDKMRIRTMKIFLFYVFMFEFKLYKFLKKINNTYLCWFHTQVRMGHCFVITLISFSC